MDTRFNVFGVLQIAEEVEHKAARFYLKMAERLADRRQRSIYYHLASRRARHEQAWARIRREHSEKTGELGTFDPDNFVLSNPQVMAGLTCFGTNLSSPNRPTGCETGEQVVKDAIRRSEGVVIFFRGLKEFAGDPASLVMIDAMIGEDSRHIRQLTRLLQRTRMPPRSLGRPVSHNGAARLPVSV